ncbi:hypothetical protein ACF1AB_16580 [Streptomyces sp. NPDC014846]|uniref:hypothetical protein n=1 Tax=Streptomyces sp. NPDC014846 TaxID=3364922 RepID=UPI0036F972BC
MAVQITEEQVQQAEARAEQAEAVRAQAARKLEASPYSDVAALEHTEAARTAAQQRANAREIRAKREEQLEEERRRVSRPELEKSAAAEIRAAGRQMDQLHKAFVEAVAQTQAAVVQMIDAGVAYNEGLAGHVQVLVEAGLDFRGGESGAEVSLLGSDRLKVKGREFCPYDPGSVAGWVLRRAAEARLSEFNGLVGLLMWLWQAVESEHPELVQQVGAPAAKKFPEPLRIQRAVVD